MSPRTTSSSTKVTGDVIVVRVRTQITSPRCQPRCRPTRGRIADTCWLACDMTFCLGSAASSHQGARRVRGTARRKPRTKGAHRAWSRRDPSQTSSTPNAEHPSHPGLRQGEPKALKKNSHRTLWTETKTNESFWTSSLGFISLGRDGMLCYSGRPSVQLGVGSTPPEYGATCAGR